MNSPSSIHRQNLRRNTDSASLKQIQRYILYSKLQEAQNLRRESFTSSYVTSFHGRSPSAVGSVGTPFPEDELLLLSVDSVGRWRSSMRESSLASYRWSWKFGESILGPLYSHGMELVCAFSSNLTSTASNPHPAMINRTVIPHLVHMFRPNLHPSSRPFHICMLAPCKRACCDLLLLLVCPSLITRLASHDLRMFFSVELILSILASRRWSSFSSLVELSPRADHCPPCSWQN